MRSPTLILTLACTLVACGGGDNGGPVDSGLPAERKGSELTDAEAKQLCEASAKQLDAQVDSDDAHHFACVVAGIFVANGNVATCETVYDMCIKMDPKPTDSGAACTFSFDLATCDATVSVLEDCFTEQNDATAAGLKAASCDDADNEPSGSNKPTSGPACTKAQASCPGIGQSTSPTSPAPAG